MTSLGRTQLFYCTSMLSAPENNTVLFTVHQCSRFLVRIQLACCASMLSAPENNTVLFTVHQCSRFLVRIQLACCASMLRPPKRTQLVYCASILLVPGKNTIGLPRINALGTREEHNWFTAHQCSWYLGRTNIGLLCISALGP